jgi:ribosomal protein S18 acetylase RimI-like enzyme
LSELRPESAVQRPESARPREEPLPEVEPPSDAELQAIQRHVVTLPGQEGAVVSEDESGLVFVQGPGSGPDVSYAAMPRWGADEWPERLDEAVAQMRSTGAWPSLLLCDRFDRPVGMEDELQRRGWLRVTTETVLWVGHASVVPHLDPLMRIEAVQPRSMSTHEALERQIFGIGADQADRRRTALTEALEAGRVRAWIVWLDDEPVAVARLSQGQGTAGLQGIGVTRERRGQGYGTLITTIATRAGMATGNRLMWLSVRDDNPAAAHVYGKLGFERAFSWSRWLVTEDPRG